MKRTYSSSEDFQFFELANDGVNKLCLTLGHIEIQLPGFDIGKTVDKTAEIGKLTPYPNSYPHIHMGLHVINATGNIGCGCAPNNTTCRRWAIPFSNNSPYNIYPLQGFPLNGVNFNTGPN
jgi:hypothetical protein